MLYNLGYLESGLDWLLFEGFEFGPTSDKTEQIRTKLLTSGDCIVDYFKITLRYIRI